VASGTLLRIHEPGRVAGRQQHEQEYEHRSLRLYTTCAGATLLTQTEYK
jgi:hypothetical protein